MEGREKGKGMLEEWLGGLEKREREVGKEMGEKFGVREMEVREEVFESEEWVVLGEGEKGMERMKGVMVGRLGE